MGGKGDVTHPKSRQKVLKAKQVTRRLEMVIKTAWALHALLQVLSRHHELTCPKLAGRNPRLERRREQGSARLLLPRSRSKVSSSFADRGGKVAAH